MNILGLIPARGGSRGIPKKNITPFRGKPLLAWTIEAARRSGTLDRIVVSTDDEEIAAVAQAYGAEVPFLRPTELACDETPSVDVAVHALDWLARNDQYRPEYVFLLQPTSPLRLPDDITAAVGLAHRMSADAVVGVSEATDHPFLVHTLLDDGRLGNFVESTVRYPRRQDYPPAYAQNGAVFLIRTAVLLRDRVFVPEYTYPYVMPRERSIDIDTPLDLKLAENLDAN